MEGNIFYGLILKDCSKVIKVNFYMKLKTIDKALYL